MPRFNVDLTDELHTAVKDRCHRDRCAMTDIVRELLEKWVSTQKVLVAGPSRELLDKDLRLLGDMRARSRKYKNGDQCK